MIKIGDKVRMTDEFKTKILTTYSTPEFKQNMLSYINEFGSCIGCVISCQPSIFEQNKFEYSVEWIPSKERYIYLSDFLEKVE